MELILKAQNEAKQSQVEQKDEGFQSLIMNEWKLVYEEAIMTALEAYKKNKGKDAIKRLFFYAAVIYLLIASNSDCRKKDPPEHYQMCCKVKKTTFSTLWDVVIVKERHVLWIHGRMNGSITPLASNCIRRIIIIKY